MKPTLKINKTQVLIKGITLQMLNDYHKDKLK